jgi:hypothetical protein
VLFGYEVDPVHADDGLVVVAGDLPEALVPADEVAVAVVDEEEVGDRVEDVVGVLPVPSQPSLGAVPRDGILDAVRHHRELARRRLLLDVVGDVGRDRVARDLLAALPGEPEEGQVRIRFAYRLEELDAGEPRHVVVRDDAVDLVVPRGTPGRPPPRSRCGL